MQRTPTCDRRPCRGLRLSRGAGVALLFVASLGSGCAASSDVRKAPQVATARFLLQPSDRVLVLPLRDGSCLPVYGNHVMCHLTGEHLDAGAVPAGTGAELGRILYQDLQDRGVSLVPYDVGVERLEREDPAVVDAYEPALAIEVGKATGADKVIMGVVAQYEERSGSGLGSNEPAKVAFSLALVDVARGTITYKLHFNRRQAPLASNLFALPQWWRQGFSWWTRKEVAAQALRDGAEELVGSAEAGSHWTYMPARPPERSFLEWQTSPEVSH